MQAARRIRLGIVGAGPGSFIGPVHLSAARLDGEFELVCGTFSRDPAKTTTAGRGYALDPSRCYASYAQMLQAERLRPADGMECLVIATPNDTHFEIARTALAGGYHVISDKPATRTLAEAQALRDIVARSGCVYGLTYTYSGYPMIREARALLQEGRLGVIRKVLVEYLQGWLAEPIERRSNRQAAWRTDPAVAGAGGCVGDIGVHAFHLLEFVTGHRVTRLRSDVSSVVPGRVLDDDFTALLRLDNDAPCVIAASQVATGELNGLRLRVYGDRGGLEWTQERPDRLILRWPDNRSEVLHAGSGDALSDAARAATRLPAGHPEGYIEAFANLYRDFAAAVRQGESARGMLPSIVDGVRGLQFVEAVLAGGAAGDASWHPLA